MPKLMVEYAKSGRAKCACGKAIVKHEVRIGTEVILPYSDEGTSSWKWRHLCCFTDRQLKNATTSGDLESIDGLESLAPADKVLVQQMTTGALVGKTDIIGRVGDVQNAPISGELLAKAAPAKRTPKEGAAKKTRAPKAAKLKAEEEIDSDATEEYEVELEAVTAKQKCPYGASCFRTNPEHFAQFSHDDGDEDLGSATSMKPVLRGKKKARVEG